MATTNGCETNKKTFERLPEHSKPTRYEIKIKADLAGFKFTGEQTVDVEVLKATDSFTLNSKKLTIDGASVKLDDKEHPNLSVTVNDDDEKIIVKLPSEVPAGKAKLSLKFTGELNDSMRGFYRSSYHVPGDDKTEKFMASTQFESTYARMAFPCWDEPIYKAKFDITLTVRQELTALSNMNVVKESNVADGWKDVVFATSPLMSSYLVAFAVGTFAHKEVKTKEGIIVRVYTVPHNITHVDFALDCAKNALEYYNEFFGIQYPIPKCDLIAVPDFSMGAMENWGLVTFREVLLLVDPERTSAVIKSRVALVIAHELAHMWFGDLVTMKWWTDLWLKEGFANFIEYLFTEHQYPEFEVMLRFVHDEVVRGLDLDALHSSHAIEVPIENPNELEEVYDAITYAKASSCNRMLYSHLGHETFRAGLRAYLSKYQYSNAVTADLWSALSAACGTDVGTMMSTWTKQMGFPVVNADVKHQDGKCTLTLTQERFFADGTKDKGDSLWHVPVTVITTSSPKEPAARLLLKQKTQTFDLPNVKPTDWIKLNAGMTGYYRVSYSDAMMAALREPLKTQALAPADRFNLITDIFALVRAGRASCTQFLDVFEACSNTEDYLIVWQEIDAALGTMTNVLNRAADGTKTRDRLNKFIIDHYTPIANKLTWEVSDKEAPQRSTLRAVVLGRLGKAGHQPTIDRANTEFQAHIKDNKNLQADIRRVIYTIHARAGGQTAFEDMKKINETSFFPEVQRNALISLAASPDKKVLETAIDYIVNSGKVRKQDMIISFLSASGSANGQDLIWDYFKKNMEKLIGIYGDANSTLFQHIMQISIEHHTNEKVAKEAEDLINGSCYAATLNRPMRQSVEAVRLNVALLQRDAKAIADWLDKHKY